MLITEKTALGQTASDGGKADGADKTSENTTQKRITTKTWYLNKILTSALLATIGINHSTAYGVAAANDAYVYPIVGSASSYARTHHDYPATDIAAKCGAVIVAPVTGILVNVTRIDRWRQTNSPWHRSGKTIDIVGQDGVKYHLAHFQTIADGLTSGAKVQAGQRLGTVGQTGRAKGCHLHFGISPPCATPEWWVRRGAIWPAPYLDAWRIGKAKSPAGETTQWAAKYPQACADKTMTPWPST